MKVRIATLTLGLLAFAGLSGCAHEKVAISGYQWTYLDDDAAAPRLAYGRVNSDDVVLMISCRPGRDEVDLSAVGLNDPQLILASGRAETRFNGEATKDPMSGSDLLEARGRASAPALAAFRKTGDLALLTKGERHDLTAGGADRGQVRSFFRACGA